MTEEHVCWWTRRAESQLTDGSSRLLGAGLPPPVLSRAANVLGTTLTARRSQTDDYGKDIALGHFASGATHDDCYLELRPVSPALKGALLVAMLDLHAGYLGMDVDWSSVLQGLMARFTAGQTLRMRADPGRRSIKVRSYPHGSSFLRRILMKPFVIECRGGLARFRDAAAV